MLIDGLVILFVGIVFVFAFLGLLVVSLRVLSASVGAWERAHPEPQRGADSRETLAVVAAVVVAAVAASRRKES